VYRDNVLIVFVLVFLYSLWSEFQLVLVLAGHVPNAGRRMCDIRFSYQASRNTKQAYILFMILENPRTSYIFRSVDVLP
jgi:hypothetical protein